MRGGGLVNTAGGAKGALLLAGGLVVLTTAINMVGVKTVARPAWVARAAVDLQQ